MSLWQRFKRPNVWIPSAFVAFFAVVFLANGIMVWSALGTWRGLKTESPWDQGEVYNGIIDAEAAEKALGWEVGLDVQPIDGNAKHANVAVKLRDQDGQPIYAEDVQVGFIRPTDDGYDTTVNLSPKGDGVYGADVDLPLAGLWDVRVSAKRGEDAIHITRRVTLTP